MLLNHVLVVFYFLFGTITNKVDSKHGKHNQNDPENSIWKQEYEDELSEAMVATKKGSNITDNTSPMQADNEAVIEKLLESITASEKYMKIVENMDFRLNRLDVEIHEKTDDILRRLSDMRKSIYSTESIEKMGSSLNTIKKDMQALRSFISVNPDGVRSKVINADAAECRIDSALNHRLSVLETYVSSILKSMEAISSIISEVKSRQHSKTSSNGACAVDTSSLIGEFRTILHEQRGRKCDCSRMGRMENGLRSAERYPTDCREIQLQGFNISGIYKIKPYDIEAFYVLCDLTTSGGGWTVIQNRFDGSQDFYKTWSEYKYGFGNLAGEFWLGLEKLYYLTNQKLYELRIDIESVNGQEAAAGYSVFTIGPEHEGYRISTLGTYRGNAGDSLAYHAGQKFSTYDTDNDEWKEGACAVEHGGAWWYKECDKSNLNGKFSINLDEHNGQTIYWITFKGPNSPLSKTRMMIRPLPASRPTEFERSRALKDGNKEQDNQKLLPKDSRGRSPYRYNDIHSDSFFPNYT